MSRVITRCINRCRGVALRFIGIAACGLSLLASDQVASAVNLTIDYTYDTSNFFGAGNPSGAAAGAQAKAALEAAASFYSGILNDTFSAIQAPPTFSSSQFNGEAYWHWTLRFDNPSTGAMLTLQDQVIGQDEYRIYAGARNISGTTLGIGGPGGYGWTSTNNGGGFTSAEIAQLNEITSDFTNAVENREEATGFAAWGGSITFDRDGNTVWHYNHTTSPTVGTNDFYSVAIHELGHAIGLGTSDEWKFYAAGSTFTGPAAQAEYGSFPPLSPLVGGVRGHWKSGTMSRIYGTNTAQEAAMDPELTTGTRKLLTALDAAALADIGWTVVTPPPTYNPADFNEDTFVNGADLALWKSAFAATAVGDADGDGDSDGADFLIWQRQYGAVAIAAAGTGAFAAVPEPTGALLAANGGLLLVAGGCGRRRSPLGRF